MAENVSPQQPLRLLLKIDGMKCALRDGKSLVGQLRAQPGIRSAHLLFPSRTILLQVDGPASSFLHSPALHCISLAGYAASPRAPQWCAVELVGVTCITVARRIESLLNNHPNFLKCCLDFASRRVFLLGDGDSAPAVAAAAEAGVLCCAAHVRLYSASDADQDMFVVNVRPRPHALWYMA
jgi:hypothetical protein